MACYDIRPYTQYDETEILSLYKSVGWTNYTEHPDWLRQAFENSLYIAGAYQDDRLVGIIRAVGDGATILYIQDLLILPEKQHQGIGTALLTTVLEKYAHVYQKILLTDNTEKTIAFYRKLGFSPVQDLNCVGFIYVNHQK